VISKDTTNKIWPSSDTGSKGIIISKSLLIFYISYFFCRQDGKMKEKTIEKTLKDSNSSFWPPNAKINYWSLNHILYDNASRQKMIILWMFLCCHSV